MRGFRLGYMTLAVLCLLSAGAILSSLRASSPDRPASDGVTEYVIASKEGVRHDISAYTQGLFFHDGVLYESTGQYGSSSFRKVDHATGRVLENIPFTADYFLEGSCVLNGVAYILTWYEGICFVYDIASMTPVAEFRYEGQGWGLTTDGTSLIMSDGSSKLTYRDPMTFAVQKTVQVTLNGRAANYLNELEYIDGEIWANVYGTDWIYRIDPVSGKVTGRVDCSGLLEAQYRSAAIDVLNGIAFNPADGSVYLTGKYWSRMYKIALKAL